MTYVVESARGRDVRGEIFQLAAQQKWALLELRRVGMTLEEVFIRVVAGEETVEEAAAVPVTGGDAVKVWPIFKKEMRLYFTSPMAWVILTIFLLITGYFFYSIFALLHAGLHAVGDEPQMARDLNVTDSVLRPLFSNISVILLLLMPLVTMRLFAEERRSGTIELLLTYPIRDGAVLLGKYLAALALYGVMLALTLLYPAIVLYFARVEWGALATGYLGLLLMGGDVPGRGHVRLLADREPDRGRDRSRSASC